MLAGLVLFKCSFLTSAKVLNMFPDWHCGCKQ